MTEPLALQSDTLARLDTGAGDPPAPASEPPAPDAGGSASAAGAQPSATPAPAPVPSWRDKIAGGDKPFAENVLARYTDEAAFGKAHRALLQKLSSGELKEAPKPFPDKGTDAEKLAWKQANGVPDKPDLYIEKMAPPKGVVFGDADKPALERLAGFAASANWSQDQYNAVLAAYHHELAAVTTARDEADHNFRAEAEDALRADWGQDYTRNVNAMKNMLSGAPEGVRERLMGGRTADGRLIGDDPAVLRWLSQVALDLNPAATILPASMNAAGFKSRFDELEALSKNAAGEYYRGPNAKELQREHYKLIEAQEKMQTRTRAA